MPRAKLSDAQPVAPQSGMAKLSDAQIADQENADSRNGFQREVDDLTKIEPFNARPGVMGHILTGAGNVGADFLARFRCWHIL